MTGPKVWLPTSASNGIERESWNRLRAAVQAAPAEVTTELVAPERRPQRRDVVGKWFNAGRLTAEQLRAAREIARVWEAITRGLFARTTRFEYHMPSSPRLDDWPAHLARAYGERYVVWRDDPASRVLLRPRQSVADLVFRVAIDDVPVEVLKREWNLGHGRIHGLVRDSLHRYADLADWLQPASMHAIRGVAVVAANQSVAEAA